MNGQSEIVGEMKIKLYFEFVNVVMDMLKMGVKDRSQSKIKGLAIKLQLVGLQMLVVASDDVVEKFIKWRALAMADVKPELIMESFSDAVYAMRKEFFPDTKRLAEDALEILF